MDSSHCHLTGCHLNLDRWILLAMSYCVIMLKKRGFTMRVKTWRALSYSRGFRMRLMTWRALSVSPWVMEAICVCLDIKPAKVVDPSGSGRGVPSTYPLLNST